MARLPLTRLVYRAAVAPALQQQLGVYLGVLIAGAIIFQPKYGLRAVQVTDLMAASRPVRLSLWAGWLLLALPVGRALLRAPALLPLRALPLPRWRFLVVLGGALLLAELPMGILFFRGVGPLSGFAALLCAAAAHALLLSRVPRLPQLGAALLVLPVLDGRLPTLLALPAALLALPAGLAGAFRAAAEPEPPPLRAPFPPWPPLSLLVYHGVLLLRRERAPLLRALLLALIAAAIAWLCARNNDIAAPADRLVVGLVTLGLALPMGAAALSARALAAEDAARWLLDSTGTGGGARVVGSAVAVALAGAAAGAAHGATFALLLGEAPGRLVPVEVLWSAALGALTLGLLRRLRRGDEGDSERLVVIVVLLAAFAEILLWALQGLAPAVLALAALILSLASAAWAAPRGRRARRRYGVSAWTSP